MKELDFNINSVEKNTIELLNCQVDLISKTREERNRWRKFKNCISPWYISSNCQTNYRWKITKLYEL